MNHHLIRQIEEMNSNNGHKILFTIQKQYFYRTERGTFDYFIDCTFMDLSSSKLKRIAFPSENALERAIEFIIANPTYQFEDLLKFTTSNFIVAEAH